MIKNNLLILSIIMLFSGMTCTAMEEGMNAVSMEQVERQQMFTYNQELMALAGKFQSAKYGHYSRDHEAFQQIKTALSNKKDEVKDYANACNDAAARQYGLGLVQQAENVLQMTFARPKMKTRFANLTNDLNNAAGAPVWLMIPGQASDANM